MPSTVVASSGRTRYELRMALKAIIHRAGISFSDLDNHVYTDHSLTIARHPSETEQRMMIRILAYVLNAPQNSDLGYLELGKDLWEADEPALIQKDLTGFTEHWIDLGQPDEKRLVRGTDPRRRGPGGRALRLGGHPSGAR